MIGWHTVRDTLLHILGGVLVFAPLLWWGPASLFVSGFALGWLREGASHKDDGRWIGWITPHRMIEAIGWGLGSSLLATI